MREIVPELLWLGNAMDARDVGGLADSRIAAVVDLALEELPSQLARETVYCRFPLVDGAGNCPEILYAAISGTASLIRRRVPTLVCCGSGMSRSPAVVAVALAIASGDPPGDCLERVVAGCSRDVSPSLWNDVMSAYRTCHESQFPL